MTRDEVKSAVAEAIDEKLSQFWVDRELHFEHHKFIDRWMKWSDDASKTIWRTIIKAVIITILSLIALGALFRLGIHK